MANINRNLDREKMFEWRLGVMRAAKWRCECCGGPASHAHHVVSRRYAELRFDVRNGQALCVTCHADHHDKSAEAANRAMMTRRPDDWDYLMKQKRQPVKQMAGVDILYGESGERLIAETFAALETIEDGVKRLLLRNNHYGYSPASAAHAAGLMVAGLRAFFAGATGTGAA